MLRALPASILVAISLLGWLIAGCKSDAPTPVYTGSDSSQQRDAGEDERPRRPPRDAGGADRPDARAAEDGGGSEDSGAPAPAADAQPRVGCDGGPELRVLFIGNSHTYTNDLPVLVRELACSAGTRVIAQSVTPGGVGFTEHAANPDTLAAITADAWDFVVMQDQQQRPGFRLDDVEADGIPAVRTLVEAIRAHRPATRPLFYMVWARREGDEGNCAYYPLVCDFEGDTRAISEGYRLYAERTGSQLAGVALAWAAVRADPLSPIVATELWANDGSHPALAGSYLAAAMLTGAMLDSETAALPYDAGLDVAVTGYLRGVADQIMNEAREDPRVMTAEHVRIACEYPAACDAAADGAPVTFTLSTDDCDALAAGTATVSGRLTTSASCRSGQCTTVPLAGWHQVPGASIADATYQVHAHVDLNANGEADSGDLDACDSFVVGAGEELTFTELGRL